jgi:hypothetical protein
LEYARGATLQIIIDELVAAAASDRPRLSRHRVSVILAILIVAAVARVPRHPRGRRRDAATRWTAFIEHLTRIPRFSLTTANRRFQPSPASLITGQCRQYEQKALFPGPFAECSEEI